MSVSIALAVLAQGVLGSSPPQAEPPQPVALPAKDEASASSGAARLWLAQLDRQDWAKSWHAASQLFRANVTLQQWTSTIQSVRQPLGARSSRSLVSVTKTSSLPGVPAGDYEVLQFRTDFANRKNVIETVTFTREPSGWRVAGYFVQ